MADVLIDGLSPEQYVAQSELSAAFRAVLATPAGKRVLFWMLEQCAIYEDAFAGEAHSATDYTLGRQSAGRRLIGKLDELDPRIYPQLLIEVAEIRDMDRAAARALAEKAEPDDEN